MHGGRRTTRWSGAARERALLAFSKLTHNTRIAGGTRRRSRSRATPQWFISMDQATTCAQRRARRDQDGDVVSRMGQARIAGMVANRPDWCIAPAHLGRADRAVRAPRDRRAASAQRRADARRRARGAGRRRYLVHALDAAELLGDEAKDLRQDHRHPRRLVRFRRPPTKGSCCCWSAASANRRPLPGGSDQHRGLVPVRCSPASPSTRRAPYRQCLTHGFTVDEHGHQDVEVAGQRHRAAGHHEDPGRTSCACGSPAPTTATSNVAFRMRSSSATPMPTAHPQHRALPARQPERLRPARICCRLADMVALDRWIVHRAWQVQEDHRQRPTPITTSPRWCRR